ncbi:hypothetical protein P7C73_g1232, partial [Tremellales sp. Uapishka_1]
MSDHVESDSSTVEISWDERHNDPQADVILVSADDVYFRIHSWPMKRESGFVNDLYTVASQSPSAPISTDVSAKALRFFTNLVYSDSSPLMNMSLDEIKEVLAVCDRLQCQRIEERVLKALGEQAGKDPWQIFIMASQRDDVELAKSALKAMENTTARCPVENIKDLTAADIEAVDPRYLSALLASRLSLTNMTYDPDQRPCLAFTRWTTVSASFKLCK